MEKIEDLLNEVIAKEAEEKNKLRTGGAITPSQLGKCSRAIMCKDKGLPELPFTATQLRTFAAGFIFEEFALTALEKTGKIVERQLPVEYRGITGTLDAIVHINGKNVLFDCKSVKTDKFMYLDKGEADNTYAMQLSFYHRALKGKIGLDPVAIIFYIEKDNILTREIPVQCENYYKQLDTRIDELFALRAEKNLPPETPPEEWMCFTVSKRYKTVKVWCQHIKNCPKKMEAYKKSCAEMNVEIDGRLK